MTVNKNEKQEILEKLNLLLKKQSIFQEEINELRLEIATLQVDDLEEANSINEATKHNRPFENTEPEEIDIPEINEHQSIKQIKKERSWNKSGFSAEVEKFIGENLINKIGLIVLIIGVGIGVKYAIDNDLISPLVRILLGYLVGATLTFFAIRLKTRLLNFSAVLMSGAMAVYYFITYAACNYYHLFPQIISILVMVFITIVTVWLAIYYNKQVIAHFGLIGAYIVPNLLKEPFTNVAVLFIYMFVINVGILFISTRKHWKPVNFVALIITWAIFISWFASSDYHQELPVCLIFIGLFFTIFHLIFLSYKLLLTERFKLDDMLFMFINSGVLFFVGYTAINQIEDARTFLGLFTFINALIYGLTALIIHKFRNSDPLLLKWNIAFALALFTVAIPVQFGNFETAIIWSFEAVGVFLIGRYKKSMFFEICSYFIILSLFFITMNNWTSSLYNLYHGEILQIFTPVLNYQFLSSITAVIAFTAIFVISNHSKSKYINNQSTPEIFKVLFPITFFLIVYFTFYTEINLYWGNRQIDTCFSLNENGAWVNHSGQLNSNLLNFRNIWLLNYTLIFALIISFANYKWIHKIGISAFNLIFHVFIGIMYLTLCIGWINELFQSHLNPATNQAFTSNSFYVGIRYVEYIFFTMLLISLYKWIIPLLNISTIRIIFDIVVCIAIVRILSNELISWFSISGSSEIYKYGLSVLWGVLSLLAVGYGIWSRKKHLRITGIALFGITLLKLFFYDLTNLDTIPKTLVFILTGALLLVVSFLYNKYTNKIFDENN